MNNNKNIVFKQKKVMVSAQYFPVRTSLISNCLKRKICRLFPLTPSVHVHVYILEKSQHKVPEEALKVSKSKLPFLVVSARLSSAIDVCCRSLLRKTK